MVQFSRKSRKGQWTKTLFHLFVFEVACFSIVLVYFVFSVPEATKEQHDEELSRFNKNLDLLQDEHKQMSGRSRTDSDLSENLELIEFEKQVSMAFGKKVQSCLWFRRAKAGTDSELIVEDQCKNSNFELVAYNNFTMSRLLCGTEIKPRETFQIRAACKEVPRLFRSEPTVSGEGLPPTVVTSDMEPSDTDHWLSPKISKVQSKVNRFIVLSSEKRRTAKPVSCSVPCKTMDFRDTGGVIRTRGIEGTKWQFTYSMEGSHYYSKLNIDKKAFLEDRYYATTSFQSDVPLPYFSLTNYNIQQPAIDFDKVIAGASFIARNCGSKNKREKLVEDLSNHFRVDSLSSCLHNAEPPSGLDLSDKKKLQQQYLFHLAFENGNVDDYITEKLWGTLESGTLPVYFGAPNVKEHVPPNSIIVVQDFRTVKELGLYLHKVATNKTLYESYHAWRKEELPSSFHQKYYFSRIPTDCRFCRWGYAKRYGFKWNHTAQEIEEPEIPRIASLGNSGEINGVFRETWFHQPSKQYLPLSLSSTTSQNQVQVGDTSVTRSVFNHDGVVDVDIQQRHFGELDSMVLQMETATRKGKIVDKQIFGRFTRAQIQDSNTRFTVCADWPVDFSSHSDGVLSVRWTDSFHLQRIMRLRIIVESLDKFHQGGENAPYYFGNVMAQDFMKPLLMFRVI